MRKLAANSDVTLVTLTKLVTLITIEQLNSLAVTCGEVLTVSRKKTKNFYLLKALFSLILINKEAVRKHQFRVVLKETEQYFREDFLSE